MRRHVAFPLCLALAFIACNSPDSDISVPEDAASSLPEDGSDATTDAAESTDVNAPAKEGSLGTFTLEVGPFQIQPGEEKTRCAYAKVPHDFPTDLTRIQSVMNEGCHHMNLYLSFVPHEDGSAVACGPETMTSLIAYGAQTPEEEVLLPSGIGLPLAANQQLVLEAHYINVTPDPIEGSGQVTLTLFEPEALEEHAGVMAFFPNQIQVPPFENATSTTRCVFPFDAELFVMNSHMHHFGTLFEAFVVDPATDPETRTPIYTNEDWHRPEYKVLDHDDMIPVNAGDIVEFSCHYTNDTASTVYRGGSGETDEMCIFGGAYKPFHGILLCQDAATECHAAAQEVTPQEALICPSFGPCLINCPALDTSCWNCCLEYMDLACMTCVQEVLGCALTSGCGQGLGFDFNCILGECSEEISGCLL